MTLTYEQLKEKITGCWNGKNIGGVLGAPFECKRDLFDVDFYVQENIDGNPPPNDDLDLQLLWLIAVERFGRGVNASILGDYWLSYVVPDWCEYGSGKTNLKRGLLPPLTGMVSNPFKNSCGCFIRSEIWACLAPGHPEIATQYAYEDAIVDHHEDGMYAEIFCAAIQSAAFVESDKHKLIDIGLSYIPEDCGVARAVKLVIAEYKKGTPYPDTRIKLMNEIPGNFGILFTKIKDRKDDFPLAEPGHDAANNIGIMIIGWLYGEDDFAKSIIIATNCGEDTDCTAATLGATLGIIHGNSSLPEKWLKPLGGVINTLCLDKTVWLFPFPETVDELSDRVLRAIPVFLGVDGYIRHCDILSEDSKYTVTTAETFECEDINVFHPHFNTRAGTRRLRTCELMELSPYTVKHEFTTFNALLDYCGEPFIKPNEPKKLKLTISENMFGLNVQWFKVRLYTSDNITIQQGNVFTGHLQKAYPYRLEFTFDVLAEQLISDQNDIIIDISVVGRHTNGIIKATLMSS